jgi:AcrR family transcriptional regulator
MSFTAHEPAHSSRERLLAAGKSLFSRLGYEQTSTSAIAREAGTSESQLVRYFGGKSGLLEAIFNEAWSGLNDEINRHVSESEHGREAIIRILGLILATFARDQDTAFLFLFEGRRVRGHEVALSKGFLQFYDLIQKLIARGQKDGSFRGDMNVDVISAALLGSAEGMMRDRIIAQRLRQPDPFDEKAIQGAFAAIAKGFA